MKKLLAFLTFSLIMGSNAMAYRANDFSAICKSGQKLYYKITSETAPYTVEVTNETGNTKLGDVSYNTYPNGDLRIPENVTHNNITYLVTSIGTCAFKSCNKLTSVTIPNSVTEIKERAFAHCEGLTSITIPESVTEIGIKVFLGCNGLKEPIYNSNCFAYFPNGYAKEYTIPEGIKTIADEVFQNCKDLTSIVIPNSVERIGKNSFTGTGWYNNQPNGIIYLGEWCLGYKGNEPTNELIITDSTKNIANEAFSKCNKVTSVILPNSIKRIGFAAFEDCQKLASVTTGNSIIDIGEFAFSYCSNLKSINIPNTLREIKDYTFYKCQGLSSIVIPDSLKRIGKFAFYACDKLSSFVFPNSLKEIGEFAFGKCPDMKSIIIPNSVENIGECAFSGCSSLKSIVVDSKNHFYDSRNNCNAIIHTATNTLITGCKNTVIPISATIIGKGAFLGCTNLKSITIHKFITYIEETAFGMNNFKSITVEKGNSVYNSKNNCNAIIETQTNILIVGCENTTIPNSVTKIANYAFARCAGLTSIDIPKSVKCIGQYAFLYCNNLRSVNLSESIEKIEYGAFAGCNLPPETEMAISTINEDAFDYEYE